MALANYSDLKASVKCATSVDIALTGLQTIDSVILIAGDRVLVKNQTVESENGIYVVDASTWSRSADADEDAEVTSGMFTFVESGVALNGSSWILISTITTVDVSPLIFTQFSGAGTLEDLQRRDPVHRQGRIA